MKPGRARYWGLVLGVGVAAVVLIRLWNSVAARPQGLRKAGGRLEPCLDRPNCVSSQAEDPAQAIEAFHYTVSLAEARRQLLELLASRPRTRVVVQEADYIHAESRSLVFGFVDDIEFLFAPDGRTVHVRSASRVGYSDLGVNRARVEGLRRALGWGGGG